MEVVPTDGDDDDGVIWFRCPQCQGFLPKLSGADDSKESTVGSAETASGKVAEGTPEATAEDPSRPADADSMAWDSPADMMAAQTAQRGDAGGATAVPSPFLPEEEEADSAEPGKKPAYRRNKNKDEEPPPPSEPIAEYVAMLAALDPTSAIPYRPWGDYEVGQCVHHLAWEDCGVVVAKEDLPGGRHVIKCYFEDAGVVRLIEQAPR